MNLNNLIQCVVYLVTLLLLVKPLGRYMACVYQNEPIGANRILRPLERLIYRLSGVRPSEEMSWKTYAVALMIFNGLGILVVYAIQRLQSLLPLNPMAMAAVSPDSSFNTAVSFATNTNWQGYGGETTMSYLTQMLALTVQNFVSAATGMAVLVALIRGFARKNAETIGNFWVDLVRSTVYILLPLSIVFSLVLVWQGLPQTFKPSITVPLLQPTVDSNKKPVADQLIAIGPVASQLAIKQLGTNGGGYFNANSAHPYENPTPLSNFLEMEAILLIAAALCYTFGKMVGKVREGWALLAAMLIVFIPVLWLCVAAEQGGNPAFEKLRINQAATPTQSGGNMEGKEVRFGIADSAIWATATTAASNGSVNSMHDSFTPLGGLAPMFLMKLGEVVFGGVGSGLYGLLIYVLIAVLIAGLMVGRTPEYLGKKIEAYEIKMASIAALVTGFFVLFGTAISVVVKPGLAGMANPGAHGFSEVLYAFASATGNNGSAFAGLGANTPYYNTMLGIVMFFSRFWIIIPVLAIAGSLARKKIVPAGAGTLRTDTPLFVFFLASVVIIVGALTFFPAMSLGPIVEHFMMVAGVS
ncbi:MAG TPA: potassium-transporting ATPase subunit KdpA [Elusimicrobiota bacterium]|nr:potassium-transporting ATPase subunit KdpA [Elusimicrobiota bacterium]